MVGTFSTAAVFNLLYLQTQELYHTSVRNSALGKMGKGKLFMGFGEEKASSGAKAVPGGAPAKVGF